MNLPKAIEIMKKKELEEAKVNIVTLSEETGADQPMSSPQVSIKVHDVEYEEDYETDMAFGASEVEETHHASLKQEEEPTMEVRDYSINSWNGSPGLVQWGYDEKYHEQLVEI